MPPQTTPQKPSAGLWSVKPRPSIGQTNDAARASLRNIKARSDAEAQAMETARNASAQENLARAQNFKVGTVANAMEASQKAAPWPGYYETSAGREKLAADVADIQAGRTPGTTWGDNRSAADKAKEGPLPGAGISPSFNVASQGVSPATGNSTPGAGSSPTPPQPVAGGASSMTPEGSGGGSSSGPDSPVAAIGPKWQGPHSWEPGASTYGYNSQNSWDPNNPQKQARDTRIAEAVQDASPQALAAVNPTPSPRQTQQAAYTPPANPLTGSASAKPEEEDEEKNNPSKNS